MRFLILFMVFLYALDGFSQGHIAPSNGPQEHTGGICYGYAMGRAAGRSAGDPVCDRMTFNRNVIDPDFFQFHADSNLSGLQVGDIVLRAKKGLFSLDFINKVDYYCVLSLV